jgi:hypothetical protein
MRLANYKYYDLVSLGKKPIVNEIRTKIRPKSPNIEPKVEKVKQSDHGIPQEPGSEDCCMSGCAICVWDIYSDELENYNSRNQTEIEIDPALKAFIELEKLKRKS